MQILPSVRCLLFAVAVLTIGVLTMPTQWNKGSVFSNRPAKRRPAMVLIHDRLFWRCAFVAMKSESMNEIEAITRFDRVPVVRSAFSRLAFHADAPIYIPVAKTRIPAAPVTCERIYGST
jgi:hypothetical protein